MKHVIRFAGIFIGTLAFKGAWEVYNGETLSDGTIITYLIMLAIFVNFSAACINNTVESNEKR